VLEHLALDGPRRRIGIEAAETRVMQRVDDLAVDVELELRGCAVADAHRTGMGVTG